MKLIDATVHEFINQVDSNSATPGGGSVSAYSIALGIGLIRMVAHVTIGKKKFLLLDEKIKSDYYLNFNQLEPLKTQAETLIDEDTDAFNKIMDAFKLSKNTDEEINIRNKAIELATLGATEVPYNVACIGLKALEITSKMIVYANKNAISDLGVGSLLISSGIEGAILNVKTNMLGFSNQEKVSNYAAFCFETLEKAKKIHQTLMDQVHQSLNIS